MISICPHCLEEASVLSFDKRGAPFTRCSHCGSMSFLKHPDAIRGIAVAAPWLRTMVSRTRASAELAREFQAEIVAFQQRLAQRFVELQRAAEATSPAVAAATQPQPAWNAAQNGMSDALHAANDGGK